MAHVSLPSTSHRFAVVSCPWLWYSSMAVVIFIPDGRHKFETGLLGYFLML